MFHPGPLSGSDSTCVAPNKPYILVLKWERFGAASIQSCAEIAFPDVEVVVCHRGADALALIRARPAWIGLFGLSLPDVDGLDLIATIGRERSVSRLLIVSGRQDERSRSVLRTASINGYFDCATEHPDDLVEATRRVGQGGSYYSASLRQIELGGERAALSALLTVSELQVFAVIGDGTDDGHAAERLGLSPTTIHTYRQRIMRKLGVQTRAGLIKEALHRGIVRLGKDCVLRPGFDRHLPDRNGKVDSDIL